MLEKPLQLKAALFDFDGTLCDTEPLNTRCAERVLRSLGVDPTEEELESIVGNDDALVVPPILERAGVPYTIDDYFRGLDFCREVYFEEPLVPYEGEIAYIERLRSQGVRCAVVSSSPSVNIAMALSRMGMLRLFDAVVCREQVGNVIKPAPDLYLHALDLLGVEAGECIAFEDSAPGIAAAHAAGIYTFGFAGGRFEQDLSTADAIIDTWCGYRITH